MKDAAKYSLLAEDTLVISSLSVVWCEVHQKYLYYYYNNKLIKLL